MNNEIIKFDSITEREDGVKLVSARELHEKLEITERFSQWFTKKVSKYDFIEGEDYTSVKNFTVVNNGAKREIEDYAVTIDMAKELCMVQNNKQGKKCRRYFINLEKENKLLKEDNKQLYNVAISDKELEQRQYEANKVKYALRNVKSLLLDCDYTNLENEVNNIINVHTNLKKKDRYEYHRDMSNTEYKQYVRKFVKDKLEEIMVTKKDMLLVMVAKTIQLRLESDSHTTTKKSSSHIISAKEKANKVCLRQIRKLEAKNDINKVLIDDYKAKYDKDSNDINNYEVVEVHGMSCNYLFKYDSQFGMIKTNAYKKWIRDFTNYFTNNQLATKEDWEDYMGVDFSKPIVIYIKYIAKEEFDCSNFDKATIDMIFNRLFTVDDNIVYKVVSEKIGTCDEFEDGKIFYYIENL